MTSVRPRSSKEEERNKGKKRKEKKKSVSKKNEETERLEKERTRPADPSNLPMRMLHIPLLPPGRITSPINPMDPPLPLLEPQRLEQLDVDIDIRLRAAHALVHDLDAGDRLAVVGVVDGDGGAAEGVVVGVGGGEFEVGDGDDGLAGLGGDGAGGVGGDEGGGVEG